MNPQYDFDDIDDYLKGHMSDADRTAFETAVSADPQLARQVEALRAEAAVLRSVRREALLEKMAAWENEAPAQPEITLSWYRRWPMAAAAAAIAALLVWALWRGFQAEPESTGIAGRPDVHDSSTNNVGAGALNDSFPDIAAQNQEKDISNSQKQPTIEPRYAELANRNFDADYSSINLMGEPDHQIINSQLQLAAEAIEHKQYDRALALLKNIPAANPDDFPAILDDYYAAQIMTGDVYFLQKKFALAEKAYIQPAKSTKDKFRDVAQWRLLLAYLAMYPQKSADFERIMTTILNDPDHPYFESAKSVRSEMNN